MSRPRGEFVPSTSLGLSWPILFYIKPRGTKGHCLRPPRPQQLQAQKSHCPSLAQDGGGILAVGGEAAACRLDSFTPFPGWL
jgi:hypothetical protein